VSSPKISVDLGQNGTSSSIRALFISSDFQGFGSNTGGFKSTAFTESQNFDRRASLRCRVLRFRLIWVKTVQDFRLIWVKTVQDFHGRFETRLLGMMPGIKLRSEMHLGICWHFQITDPRCTWEFAGIFQASCDPRCESRYYLITGKPLKQLRFQLGFANEPLATGMLT
jgi:hypothetical protein